MLRRPKRSKNEAVAPKEEEEQIGLLDRIRLEMFNYNCLPFCKVSFAM